LAICGSWNPYASLLDGIGEIRRRIHDLGLRHRVDKVSAGHILQCMAHRVAVEQFAHDNLDTLGTQCRGAVVILMDKSPDMGALRQQFLNRVAAGSARSAGNQI